MNDKLSERRAACLRWYRDRAEIPSPEGRIMNGDEIWDSREMNWCLEHGLLWVGKDGWHVPTAKGLAAIVHFETH